VIKRPLLALSTFALSCSTATVVNTTYNLSRANDVAFVCLQTGDGRVTPLSLSQCGLNSSDNTSTSDVRDPATGALVAYRHLYAVVSQSERGELAVVDLAAASGTSLIDNSPEYPGFSFIPVGGLPTALVTDVRPAGTPSSIWVASTSDRAVQRIDAATILYNPRRASDAGREIIRGAARLPMDSAPRDLALDTVGARTLLYATVPDRAAVAVFDVTDPTAPVDLGLTPIGAPSDADASVDGGLDASVDAGDAGPLPGVSHPTAITVDAESHRVYVADDRTTFVHVLEGAPLRETGRIDLGVPTRSLAVTGWARRLTCDGEAVDPDHYGRAKYLYAAHATTGAVHVYDLTRGARVMPNVLPVPNPERRQLDPSLAEDRVALTTPAVALVPINTAEYQGPAATGEIAVSDACRSTTTGCRGAEQVGPGFLHGVFVGVIARDGSLSVIDVDDYDAPARAGTPNVINSTRGYRFVRHAPRASAALTVGANVAAAPVISTLVRSTQRVQTSEGPTTPAVGCLRERGSDSAPCAAVGDGGVANFGIELALRPTPDEALLPLPLSAADAGVLMPAEPACAGPRDGGSDAASAPAGDPGLIAGDPYTVRNDAWTLTYEGVLPALNLTNASFTEITGDTRRVRLDAPSANFCTRGALAQAPFASDVVALLGDPTPAAPNGRCRDAFGTAATPTARDLVIAEAWQDHLVVEVPATTNSELLRNCFPLAARVQVRARNQWVVTSANTGLLTAVRADATGRCEVDPARQSAVEAIARTCLARVPVAMRTGGRCLAGRACMGAPSGSVSPAATPVFANPYFCLQVFPPVTGATARDTQLSFAITNAWQPTRIEASFFPTAARFLPTVNRFYVVDTQSTGLIEYRTDPIARSRTFN
jgi:hypothetical protein